MIFAPVRLGETSLNAEAVAADKKSCKRFGPCGVGKEALFLNSYFIDRRYYVAFSSVRRVFKRVAMSQGGFSGKGVFGAIPYLVVQYDGGKEKQCTFKREEDVDAMLAYIGEVHPEIPTLSVGGEQRLEQKAKEEAARYLSELTSDAQSAKEELEKAQKFLSGYPELTEQLSKAARAKRVNQHTNPAYRWVALAIVLAGAAALLLQYGQEPEESCREIAPILAKNLTKSQIMRTIELLQKYRGECTYNVGTGHVLGAIAVELEGIL